MKRFSPVLGCIFLLAASAGAADIHAVLTTPRQRVETADFRVSGRLVRVDAQGVRTTLPLTIAALGSPRELRVLIETGGTHRSRILLQLHANGEIAAWIARPGAKSASAVAFADWANGPLGNGFSYEDFLEEQYFWPDQSVVEQTRYGARLCDVVVSVPGAVRTHYAKIETWFDHGIGFPVHVEKTLRGSGVVKEFTYMGLRHDGGVWSAAQVEEKTRGQMGSTLLIIDHGSAKANLSPGYFSLENLVRFQD